jgi:hypothetical protein
VSIFEGITGVFQDAHLSKKVSTFEPGEHLRRAAALHPVPQGTALNPVPFARKVVLSLVSASRAFVETFM